MCISSTLGLSGAKPDACTIAYLHFFVVYLQNYTRFYFEYNSAAGLGQTMDVFTLRQCRVFNFLPASVARLAPDQSNDNLTVMYKTQDDHQSTVTGPNFVFFYGASTKCYKQVNNTVYLLPNCSHDLLNET